MQKTIKSFGYALNGLKTVWKEERNFKIEVFFGLVIVFCMYYFQFSFIEKMFCIIAMTIILSLEVINTAVEDLCNKVEPRIDPVIAKIKDTSSAGVLLAGLGAVVLVVFVFLHHFFV